MRLLLNLSLFFVSLTLGAASFAQAPLNNKIKTVLQTSAIDREGKIELISTDKDKDKFTFVLARNIYNWTFFKATDVNLKKLLNSEDPKYQLTPRDFSLLEGSTLYIGRNTTTGLMWVAVYDDSTGLELARLEQPKEVKVFGFLDKTTSETQNGFDVETLYLIISEASIRQGLAKHYVEEIQTSNLKY